jgi:photosystem II stability/assembly factor-like uncharacterized protein
MSLLGLGGSAPLISRTRDQTTSLQVFAHLAPSPKCGILSPVSPPGASVFRSLSISIALGVLAGAVVASFACSDGFTSTTTGFATDGRQSSSTDGPTLTPQVSGTTQRFFAVSPVDDRVVWASAAGGTFARTINGGDTWHSAVVPGAEALQFRDVQGISDQLAYLLSSGEGPANRIYMTEDGGATWTLQFQAGDDPRFFYDCFDFWSAQRAITFADGIEGHFPAIKTENGRDWTDIGDQLPAARTGEAAFAASGTCVKTQEGNRAWIGTGGGSKARVLATTNAGNSWTAHDVPILQGTPTSGVVSIDFRDRYHGILGGGDVATSDVAQKNVARSSDGGETWTLVTRTPFKGAVYGLSYVPTRQRTTVVATGPGGAAWSPDEGESWTLLEGVSNFWAVAFASKEAGWLVGGDGTILKVSF